MGPLQSFCEDEGLFLAAFALRTIGKAGPIHPSFPGVRVWAGAGSWEGKQLAAPDGAGRGRAPLAGPKGFWEDIVLS